MLQVQEAKWQLNLDDTTVFHVFVHRLPADLRNKLELLRITSVGNSAKLDWKAMVRLVHDELRGTSLGMPVVSLPQCSHGTGTGIPVESWAAKIPPVTFVGTGFTGFPRDGRRGTGWYSARDFVRESFKPVASNACNFLI